MTSHLDEDGARAAVDQGVWVAHASHRSSASGPRSPSASGFIPQTNHQLGGSAAFAAQPRGELLLPGVRLVHRPALRLLTRERLLAVPVSSSPMIPPYRRARMLTEPSRCSKVLSESCSPLR